MTDSLQEARRRLEKAIAADEYLSAQQALLEYSRAVSAAATGLNGRDAHAAEILKEALEALMRARRAVEAGREHKRQELGRVSASRGYRTVAEEVVPTESTEG